MSMNTDTHLGKCDRKKEGGGEMRERMDSINKRGEWAPPRGRELFLHSHLSDQPGVLDSDGLEDVLEPANVRFVESVATRRTELMRNGGDASSKNEELVTFVMNQLIKLHQAPRTSNE